MTAQWFDPLFRTEAMRRIFSDAGRLQGMLDFEAALARAQGRLGVIPAGAAQAIEEQCQAAKFDLGALSQASAQSGNSAIPVVKELTRLVAVADTKAAHYVHGGATSQDAMDTGLMLQLRAGLELLEADARELCAALEKLAVEHKQTPIAGRTWMQHAAPTSFGLKVARWLSAMARAVARLEELRRTALVLQLGGAVGTLAAMGDKGEKTVELVAEELKLPPAEMPWHTQRDRLVEIAAALGVMVGTLGKIAGDIALLSQSEVAEVAEPSASGRGGSSSMPQKKNPIGCASVLATATRVPALVSIMLSAMRQEHERALDGWQAEWETLPEILLLASGALGQMKHVVGGLKVDAARMRANLEITQGQIYAESLSSALSKKLGHAAAHEVVEKLSRRAQEEGKHLRDAALADAGIIAQLAAADVKVLFEPEAHVRAAARLVDQAVAAAKKQLAGEVR